MERYMEDRRTVKERYGKDTGKAQETGKVQERNGKVQKRRRKDTGEVQVVEGR
jgi:hypothetical protein